MAAPLAQIDEDWQDFNQFKPSSDGSLSRLDQINSNVGDTGLEEFSDIDNSFSGEICGTTSVEDLVHDFDEKLSVCFRNYNTTTENITPVNPITEDNFLKNDEIWNSLTGNYGNVMPVDWRTSHTRSLHLPTLNLCLQEKLDSVSLDVSDDEELREQMDLHSIIVSCVNDEPLFTAEQVIEEIEEMMEESPDIDEMPSRSDLSALSMELHTLSHSTSTNSYEERVRGMGVCELEELLVQMERETRCFSEELIQQLALRDELDFEKEVKNAFISVLIDVQNRQKEHREMTKRRKKGKTAAGMQRSDRTHMPGTFAMEGLSTVIHSSLSQSFQGSRGDRQYLTTVIPYEKKSGSPSVEDLQILTKILRAMREDSEKVPSLLTDYILKVLCPT